ncbi:Hypothetical predicted protein [Marmota monax]|uniref:Uncharacterized protein n=1 Tax=Marmota monax TaxID=9995 RepID=A0A5E4C9W6_MARMO|nr:hypothetical protein GHT09_013053 [Marmota monax]VTJ77989.1 Hypothetical predicted protein [Marmota monax]
MEECTPQRDQSPTQGLHTASTALAPGNLQRCRCLRCSCGQAGPLGPALPTLPVLLCRHTGHLMASGLAWLTGLGSRLSPWGHSGPQLLAGCHWHSGAREAGQHLFPAWCTQGLPSIAAHGDPLQSPEERGGPRGCRPRPLGWLGATAACSPGLCPLWAPALSSGQGSCGARLRAPPAVAVRRAGELAPGAVPAKVPHFLQCCQTLLSHRADPSLRDEDGYTAADLAEYHGHQDCAQYLREMARPVSPWGSVLEAWGVGPRLPTWISLHIPHSPWFCQDRAGTRHSQLGQGL